MDLNIKINYSFTEQQLLDLLDTAGRGARYWASSKLEYETEAKKALNLIGAVIKDEEAKKAYILRPDMIEQGLKIMAKKYPQHFIDFAVREDYDQATGDVFLQCCLFGEIIYS